MIKRLLLGIITIGLFSFQCQAEDAQWKDNVPETYTVKKGDTLWGISGQYLTNPWKWPEIWKANPQVANPNLIYPGDVLNVVTVDGKKMLSVDHGDKKLSPSIHSTELENPIPAIPLDVISPFLTGSRIVSSETMESAPYIISTGQEQIVAGAGDMVYARGSFDKDTAAFGIYRKEKPFHDPQTKEFLGVQAVGVGVGRVKSVENDVATLSLITASQEVRLADRLLVSDERRQQSIFYPQPPADDVSGEIISVEGGVSQIGVMSVVVINRGARENIEAGQVLAIYQRGAVVHDPVTNAAVKLPNQRAGVMMVFNVFEKASYALVLQADRALQVGDLARKP